MIVLLYLILASLLAGCHGFTPCHIKKILATRNMVVQIPRMMIPDPLKALHSTNSFATTTTATTTASDVSPRLASISLKMAESKADSTKSLKEKLKVGAYFGLWYAFNIAYNIYNKKVLNQVQ